MQELRFWQSMVEMVDLMDTGKKSLSLIWKPLPITLTLMPFLTLLLYGLWAINYSAEGVIHPPIKTYLITNLTRFLV